jgi:alpha-mannosidase
VDAAPSARPGAARVEGARREGAGRDRGRRAAGSAGQFLHHGRGSRQEPRSGLGWAAGGPPATSTAHLLLVPHTHWDREWYRTREEFRHRLVRLVDGLLDLLERDPGYRHFTLDGQAVVLDDYLEVRPRARPRIERLVRAGRLLVGPWYVLPDEWLVSGEALVRNLRLGLERAQAFGGAMAVGYVPDQFGHVGQLPQILAGFGLDCAVLWRGVPQEASDTLFHWEAPDGTRLLTVYLVHGYGNAAQLPLEPRELARRLRDAAAALAPRSRIPTLLLMNGSDHLEPQPGLPAALAAAAAELAPMQVEIGTLPGFVARARREAPAELPLLRGELRSGLRAPLLAGCASARAEQKRAEFHDDRLLVRYLEPLSAWLGELGGDPDPGILELAWRTLLECHPHDSICGCSVDAVHDEIDGRLARVAQIGAAELARVTAELGARVRSPGGAPGLVAWNPHAGGLARAEGAVELDLGPRGRRPPALHARDAAGRRIPVQAELEEAGALLASFELPAALAARLVRGFPPEFMGLVATGVRRGRESGRPLAEILLGSRRAPGFDLAAARERIARELEARGDAIASYRVRRLARVRLRLVDELPGFGIRVYALGRGRAQPSEARAAGSARGGRLADGGAWIENEAWRIEAGRDGRVSLLHRASGRAIPDALRLVSEGDRGDEYTFDAVPGGERVERPRSARVRIAASGPAEATLALDLRYALPAALAKDRARRAPRRVACAARLRATLAAGLDRIDLELAFENRARDHRLRLHVRAPLRATRFEVESAFEVAERPIAPAPDAFGSDRPAERPSGATPQRGFATVGDGRLGLTVASRGSAEVEAVPEVDGTTSLAVTVLRAVGWLSRDDLAARPGHAGPALATPGAQAQGLQRCELSLRLHAAGDPARIAEAQRFVAPPLLFAGGGAAGALGDGDRLLELDDPEVVVSALEPRADRPPELRLVNLSARARRVRVRWNGRGTGIERVDLRGEPVSGGALAPGPDGRARLDLRPWEITALRPTRGSGRCARPAGPRKESGPRSR